MNQIGITFLILGIATLLLLGNIFRPDIVALLLLLSLGLTGILTPQEAFSGFSRSAVIIMISAFILAEGLRRAGVTERLGNFILRLFGKGETRLIFGVMTAGALLSLFMNNIAAASLLFPRCRVWRAGQRYLHRGFLCHWHLARFWAGWLLY